MSKSRHIRVRGERRDPPDLRRLSRALIALVQAQLEAEAAATHAAEQEQPQPAAPPSTARRPRADRRRP